MITQNIDNLHERAGSSQVIHLHGELTKARHHAEKVIVANEVERVPFGYKFIRSSAASKVPYVVNNRRVD